MNTMSKLILAAMLLALTLASARAAGWDDVKPPQNGKNSTLDLVTTVLAYKVNCGPINPAAQNLVDELSAFMAPKWSFAQVQESTNEIRELITEEGVQRWCARAKPAIDNFGRIQ
jgi:hypothetical protein